MITNIDTITYNNYLLSKEWKQKRRQKLQKISKCEACSASRGLQIHHLHYKNIFCENINNDLVVLCKRCHKKVHEWFDYRTDRTKTLEEISKKYIESFFAKNTKQADKIDYRNYKYRKKWGKPFFVWKEKKEDSPEIRKAYFTILNSYQKKLNKLPPNLRGLFEKKLYNMLLTKKVPDGFSKSQ